MPECDMLAAVNLAMSRAMQQDDSVIVLGEDVGVDGGVFRATNGLLNQFGKSRVLDTPLAESVIAGLSVGAAAQGLRPVAEIQFAGFIYPAIDQMINHASRLRNRTRGRLTCPMVLRAPFGGGIHAPEHHSESPEALFAHMPGLRVVIPSSPRRAYGLLLAAIASADPVVFLEPKRIYHVIKERVEDDGAMLSLDDPIKLRDGDDVTVITWGAMLHESEQAVDQLNVAGVSVELFDVANLAPLNDAALIKSVQKTGRCIIVHEAARSGGFGAEIAARLADQALTSLIAPIKRVSGYDTIMPMSRLESCYLPTVGQIVAAANSVMRFE